MAKYDGLIIPRSYNDYINKSDPLGVSQALQLTGVMDDTPTAGSSKPVKSSGLVGLSAVDVVETGNMHSVTSNAVSRAMSYSTTEQKTGGKWIDGKPIYKKTFYSATNWANYAIIGNIPNIGTIVTIKDITGQSDNKYIQNFGMNNDGTQASYSNVDVSSGNVAVIRLGTFANNLPSTVTIEYTKTN
jgi:hypothetical protein